MDNIKPNSNKPGLFARVREHHLGTKFVLLATLSVGVLAGLRLHAEW